MRPVLQVFQPTHDHGATKLCHQGRFAGALAIRNDVLPLEGGTAHTQQRVAEPTEGPLKVLSGGRARQHKAAQGVASYVLMRFMHIC